MKKPAFIITIPQPCAQNWDEMTPAADKGRFCGACQKTVIDFTGCTDAEIIKMMEANRGPVCGRYNQWQLNRELILPPQQSFGKVLLSRIAASLLLFQAIVTTAWSQTVKPKTHQSATDHKAVKDKGRSITGQVLDGVTRTPLSQMTVWIEGTNIVDTTSKTGHFRLRLPENFNKRTVTLSTQYRSGYGPEGTIIPPQDITLDSGKSTMNIILYRYPAESFNTVVVKAYRKPELIEVMGAMPRLLSSDGFQTDSALNTQKRTFWQKITTPFRKKHKTND